MPTVSIRGNSKTYEINIGENLFSALKAQGHELTHGCLSGTCGACRIEVHKGSEALDVPDHEENLTLNFIKRNYERIHGPGSLDGKIIRLSCRAKASGQGQVEISELT